MLRTTRAVIVLSSDWRRDRDLRQLRDELSAAGIEGSLVVLGGQARWREIEAWMLEHAVGAEEVVIVDDGYYLGALGARFVRASPLSGFDDDVARAIVALFERPS